MSLNPTPGWLFRRTMLTVLFWIGAIFLLLFMSGMRINWTAHTISATSSISIGLLNKEKAPIEYVLNGESHTGTTPIILNDLNPGKYTLTIRRLGRTEWTRSFQLGAGSAANFTDILLVPSLLTPRTPTADELKVLEQPIVIADEGIRLHDNELYVTTNGAEALLLRLSEAITQAVWLPKKIHIVLLAGTTVALVEKSGTNMTPLFSVPAEVPVSLALTNGGSTVLAKVGTETKAYDLVEPHGPFWYNL